METLFYQPTSLFMTEALLIDALRKRANLEISQRDELIAEYKKRVALRDELLKNLVPVSKAIPEALPQTTEPPVAALQRLDQGAAIDALYAQRLSQTLDTAAQYLADVDVQGAERSLTDFRTSLGPKDRLDSPFVKASYAIADNLSNVIARLSTAIQDSAAQRAEIKADPATLAALQAARADLEAARAALGAKDAELAATQTSAAAAKSEADRRQSDVERARAEATLAKAEADKTRAELEASRSQAASAQAQAAVAQAQAESAQAQADKARAELGQSQASLLQEGAANEALRERLSELERIAAAPPPTSAPAAPPSPAPSPPPTAAPGLRGAFLGTVAISAGNRLVIDLVEGARILKGGQVEVYARGARGEEAPLARGTVTALRVNSAEISLENPDPAATGPAPRIQDAVYAIQ